MIHPENSTHLYYESHAVEYFEATYSTDMSPLWGQLSTHLMPSAKILDLGCGSGRDAHYFASRGFCPVGLDYSISLLRLAKQRCCWPVVLADICALPFKYGAFDAVWAVASL